MQRQSDTLGKKKKDFTLLNVFPDDPTQPAGIRPQRPCEFLGQLIHMVSQYSGQYILHIQNTHKNTH